jgi:hypothetical protein
MCATGGVHPPRTAPRTVSGLTEEEVMRFDRSLGIAALTVACTAAVTPSALAGGEPRNMSPFTASAPTARSTAGAIIPASAIASARAAIVAEPKNLSPFSRSFVVDSLSRYPRRDNGLTSIRSGEAKNDAPFTLPSGRSA